MILLISMGLMRQVVIFKKIILAVGAQGTIIRSMTPEDEFVWQRLTGRRDEAFERCQDLLKAHDRSALLIDAEILFDAKSIFFYFLGEPPHGIESLITNLGERFEAEIEFAKFVEAVETGCGPGCGTDEAVGCGDSCASCAVAQACKK